MILLENATKFRVGRGADTAQLAARKHRLDQVRGIHDAARCGARADDGMDLVDEQDCAGLALELVDDTLEPLLEIAAILRPGNQRAHVERVDRAVAQHLGNAPLVNHARQPFGQRGLADAGLADEQRIVLAPPAENLHRPLDLGLPADQRIDLALRSLGIEVGRESLERTGLGADGSLILADFVFGAFPILANLAHAVRKVLRHVESRDVLHAEEVNRL